MFVSYCGQINDVISQPSISSECMRLVVLTELNLKVTTFHTNSINKLHKGFTHQSYIEGRTDPARVAYFLLPPFIGVRSGFS